MKVHFTASEEVSICLQRLGRTEDIAISPDGNTIALAGFTNNRVLLIELERCHSGKRRQLALKNAVEISSAALANPHGLTFIGDDLLVVANREGSAPVFRLPRQNPRQSSITLSPIDAFPGDSWLYSPGSVCSYEVQPGRFHVLVCNNYADYVTRHTLEPDKELKVTGNQLLLAKGLQVPDGITISGDARWIAVSNHDEQAVRLYDNRDPLDRHSSPVAYLRGAQYPHGLVFTTDDRFLVVADAGAPYLRIYARPGREWSGEISPALSLRVMSDELFAKGHYNPMEGGLKGLDLISGTAILAVTSEHMALEFFDLERALGKIRVQRGVHTTAMVSDGERCPCGSKKAYRKCCGARPARTVNPAGDSVKTRLRKAAELVQARDLVHAEALCREVLAESPDDPNARHILGFVLYKRFRYQEAAMLIRAAGTATAWKNPAMRYHYGKVLGARLLGCITTASARLRCDYDHWTEELPYQQAYSPLVSIVLVLEQPLHDIDAALESVFSQSYRHMELVVVENGCPQGFSNHIREKLEVCPIPYSIHGGSRVSPARALNEAVNLARGEYINPLDPDDPFEPDRIGEMVERVARRGFHWGFAKCVTVDDDRQPVSSDEDKYAATVVKAIDLIDSVDTVGSALLGMVSPCLSAGNLFFSRSLHFELDGFRDFTFNMDRDYCLRALWLAEPCFVESSLYHCRLYRKQANGKFSNPAQEEVERILAEYLARAESGTPPNCFAPARSTMGPGYLAGALAGNQTRLPPSRLIALDDELAALEKPDTWRAGKATENGINMVGYFRGNLGLGESARSMADTCMATGIPVNLRDAGVSLDIPQSNRSMDRFLSDRNTCKTTLFHINPDQLEGVWRRFHRRGELEDRRLIGCWYWEMDQFPTSWLPALDLVDEIWVASEFVRELVVRVTDKPVTKIPHGVEVKLPRTYRRAEFGLPEERFLFLFNFDFNSFIARKNPWATLDAFRCAFPAGEEAVGLVVKCFGSSGHPGAMARLKHMADADPRIVILDRYLPGDDMHGLQSVCDAYVSLHRAEGLGLGLAECMALGKPVIGTGYSGNLEFMTEQNSCLVDYSLIPVKPGDYIAYEAGWMWADPDIQHAADQMARLFHDEAHRCTLGRNAAEDMAHHYSPKAMADAIARRLADSTGMALPQTRFR